MRKSLSLLSITLLLGSGCLGFGCLGSVDDPGFDPANPPDPLDPVEPDPTRPTVPMTCDGYVNVGVHVYGAKIKNLLTGMPLDDVELTALQSDPAALGDFIDAWLATPAAEEKLMRWFATAFQQEGFEVDGLVSQWGEDRASYGQVAGTNTNVFAAFQRNFEESFARTALDIVKNHRPFTETVTTEQFMMTTAMLSAMAFHNDRRLADDETVSYRALQEQIGAIRVQRNAAIPANRVLDPSSPDFMRFYVPDAVPACAPGGVVTSGANQNPLDAFRLMSGFAPGGIGPTGCRTSNGRASSLFQPTDFEDWRMVTVRRPMASEQATRFFDLMRLRTANELVAQVPRVGFFTTPAFFAVWPTNDANSARVTMNQTLVVAFTQSISGSELTVPAFDDALDAEHAVPGTTCYGCHATLDPMRQFFRDSYTYFYHEQRDAAVRSVPGAFNFGGVDAMGTSVFDLANILATHPRFPRAWVQKLCYFANSAPCPEDSAEFQRVADVFVSSGFDFYRLVRELFTSPLVTGAECIETGSGDFASIARTRHFCGALSSRLGIADICGTNILWNNTRTPIQQRNGMLAPTVPDDAFSRGDETPLTVSDVNLFVNGSYERICLNVANEVVGADRMFDPAAGEAAVDLLVEKLMGLPPSDPRRADARALLAEHRDEALASGATPAVALQSTFVLSCLAPSVTGMGF